MEGREDGSAGPERTLQADLCARPSPCTTALTSPANHYFPCGCSVCSRQDTAGQNHRASSLRYVQLRAGHKQQQPAKHTHSVRCHPAFQVTNLGSPGIRGGKKRQKGRTVSADKRTLGLTDRSVTGGKGGAAPG